MYLADALAMLASHVVAVRTTCRCGWLFHGQSDNPPHQNTVGHWWRKTLRDCELTGIKLHGLRHFYASGLIAQGCDVVTVQRALGHKNPAMTLAVYSHLWPTAEDRTRAAVTHLMGEAARLPADSVRTSAG